MPLAAAGAEVTVVDISADALATLRRRADEAAAAIGANPVFASGGRTIAEVFAGRARGALPAVLDGHPAAVWQHRGEVKMIFGFTVENGRVVEIEFLADPAVLARLG